MLLPHLGLRTTTLAAVAVNLAIFAVAWFWRGAARAWPAAEAPARRPERPRPRRPAPAPAGGQAGPTRAPRRPTRVPSSVVLVAFLATGLAALAAEVVWTRVLALVVGTTVYAFSTMLTVFLLGLALGSAVFARIAQRAARPGICSSACWWWPSASRSSRARWPSTTFPRSI